MLTLLCTKGLYFITSLKHTITIDKESLLAQLRQYKGMCFHLFIDCKDRDTSKFLRL